MSGSTAGPSPGKTRRGIVIVAAVAAVVGFVAGNAFWYLASPLWIDVVVDEAPAAAAGATLASGSFRDGDARHHGRGTVSVVETPTGPVVRFADFEVTNGPDLKVWLVAHPDPTDRGDVLDGAWLSLGPLKGNIGDQNYPVPAGTDLATYGSVVIWCERFSVLFATAALR